MKTMKLAPRYVLNNDGRTQYHLWKAEAVKTADGFMTKDVECVICPIDQRGESHIDGVGFAAPVECRFDELTLVHHQPSL